jgi:tetratricopeptide (TPR) repeat protein
LAASAGAAAFAATARLTSSDARAAVLGESPALDAGFIAAEANPAALVELPAMQFLFTHRVYPMPGTAGESVGGAIPAGRWGTPAGGFTTIRTGDVEHYDAYGDLRGTYTYHDDRVLGAYGVRATTWLAGGAGFHYDRHVLEPGETVAAYGLDAGVYSRPLAAVPAWEYTAGVFSLGAVARDVAASRPSAYAGDARAPFAVDLGAAWARDIGRLGFLLAAVFPLASSAPAAVGGEVAITTHAAARAGVVGGEPAFGFGLALDLVSFDYGYVARAGGANHLFTVSFNPGRNLDARNERRRQIEKLTHEGRKYFEAGKYDLALDRFASVLRWDPNNPTARQYYIQAKYRQYVAEGEEYLRTQDWERARRAFRNALIVVPDDFVAREYLTHVDEVEAAEKARQEEEERVAQKLTEARTLVARGSYRPAIEICQDILKDHPDREDAKKILAEARRLLAAATKQPVEEPAFVIPPEAAERYRKGAALLSRGAVAQATEEFEDLVTEYPRYAEARVKLVEAYTYQGLDFYSKGSLAAALRVWRRALSYDPGNEKVRRYIKKAEGEIDQIR